MIPRLIRNQNLSQDPNTRPYPSAPSHPISLKSILNICFHLLLDLSNSLFPSGFSAKSMYAFRSFLHARYLSRPPHPL